MRPKRLFSSVALVWVVFAAFPESVVHAGAFRYEYGGVITSADLSTGFVPGARFEGTFTYDPTSQIVQPTYMIEGHLGYGLFGKPSEMTLSVAGRQVFASDRFGVAVEYGPAYVVTPTAEDPARTRVDITGATDRGVATLSLSNPGRSVFPPYPMPTAFSLDDFPLRQFSFVDPTNHQLPLFSGTVDSLTALQVPEPKALATFVAALVYGYRRRPGSSSRRRANSRRGPRVVSEPN